MSEEFQRMINVIVPAGEKERRGFERVRVRVLGRHWESEKQPVRGAVFIESSPKHLRLSRISESEGRFLGIVAAKVNGKLLDINEITLDGVGATFAVSDAEAGRLKDVMGYPISEEVDPESFE